MRDFIIDGTGRVIRPGDRVVVRQMMMNDSYGAGVLVEILAGESVRVRLDSGIESEFLTVRLRREDDGEESGGYPLWSYR